MIPAITFKNIFSDDIENVFIDIILPNSKPITVGVIYRPPNQRNFLENFSIGLNRLNLNNHEIYVLGDFNFNLLNIESYLSDAINSSKSSTLCGDIKQYVELCSVLGLSQLIKTPTRITCSSSSLIDHILTSTSNKISQHGIVDIALSDHQLIYCTRKITRIKSGKQNQILFRSLKNYTEDLYEEALKKCNFPNYETFNDVDEAYSDFSNKLFSVIDNIAPIKTK